GATEPPGAGGPSPSQAEYGPEAVVKILDMGLARLREASTEDGGAPTLTKAGFVMGTPDFMAPEQARNSHSVDIRADLYSLGCTFYYILTGRLAFSGETAMEKVYKHWFEQPPSVEIYRSDVPTAVQAIIAKLMAKELGDRYQTPLELAGALIPFCPRADS